MELSLCGDLWDDSEVTAREELFRKHIVCPTTFIGNNGDQVGKEKMIYKVNGQYFKEAEAWKMILSINMCGTEVDAKNERVESAPGSPGERRGTSSPNNEKLVSSLRPSAFSLTSFNLQQGENNLVYEYHVTEGVTDKVEVKIYLYNSTDKVIISDIDGTITK